MEAGTSVRETISGSLVPSGFSRSRRSSTRYCWALGTADQEASKVPFSPGVTRTTAGTLPAHAGAGGSGRGGTGGVTPTKRVPKLVGTSTDLPPEVTPALPSKTATVVRSPLRWTTVSREEALTWPPPLTATSTASPRSAARAALTSPASTSTTAGAVLLTWVWLAVP